MALSGGGTGGDAGAIRAGRAFVALGVKDETASGLQQVQGNIKKFGREAKDVIGEGSLGRILGGAGRAGALGAGFAVAQPLIETAMKTIGEGFKNAILLTDKFNKELERSTTLTSRLAELNEKRQAREDKERGELPPDLQLRDLEKAIKIAEAKKVGIETTLKGKRAEVQALGKQPGEVLLGSILPGANLISGARSIAFSALGDDVKKAADAGVAEAEASVKEASDRIIKLNQDRIDLERAEEEKALRAAISKVINGEASLRKSLGPFADTILGKGENPFRNGFGGPFPFDGVERGGGSKLAGFGRLLGIGLGSLENLRIPSPNFSARGAFAGNLAGQQLGLSDQWAEMKDVMKDVRDEIRGIVRKLEMR